MTESRSVFITGGASGIGFATAKALVAEGHRVVLADMSKDALAKCTEELGSNAHGIYLDINDAEATAALPSAIPDGFGPIDTLINNAAHHNGGGVSFCDGKIENWASIVETNLIGMMRVTHALLPAMIEKNRGDIINVSSITAVRLFPNMGPYSASKAGVHVLTDTLRAELVSKDIRVTEIFPGLTKTNIQLGRYEGDAEKMKAYFDQFRMALSPEDIARGILFALNQPPHVQVAHLAIIPTDRS